MLTLWFKGTGDGSGAENMFEGWSDAKLDKYDIVTDYYDHSNITSRPIVLMQGYSKQRTPFFTIIHMWDKMSDFLLSSLHDPLFIGSGETGMELADDWSVVTNCGSSMT